jgi:hypothetical protein
MAEILVSDFCDDRRCCSPAARTCRAGSPENRRRQWAERARAAALADPIPAAACSKKEKTKKPIPCKSPVNRLYLQARQNLT